MKEEYQKQFRIIAWVLLGLSFLVVLKYSFYLAEWNQSVVGQVMALKVGQGDALLVQTPAKGVQILVDAGPDSQVVDELMEVMPVFDRRLEILIITHPHLDHYGGVLAILENYEVGLVVVSGAVSEEEEHDNLIQELDKRGIKRLLGIRGEKVRVGEDLELEFLHPFLSQGLEYKNLNNASLVFTLKGVEKRILFTGDLEQEGEREMLSYLERTKKSGLLAAALLKIGHHGSKAATSAELLELVKPQTAIISVGENNQFGHPHGEVLERLEKRRVEVRRTDEGRVREEI